MEGDLEGAGAGSLFSFCCNEPDRGWGIKMEKMLNLRMRCFCFSQKNKMRSKYVGYKGALAALALSVSQSQMVQSFGFLRIVQSSYQEKCSMT